MRWCKCDLIVCEVRRRWRRWWRENFLLSGRWKYKIVFKSSNIINVGFYVTPDLDSTLRIILSLCVGASTEPVNMNWWMPWNHVKSRKSLKNKTQYLRNIHLRCSERENRVCDGFGEKQPWTFRVACRFAPSNTFHPWHSMATSKKLHEDYLLKRHSCDKSTEQRHENPMKLFPFELISSALAAGGDFPRSHLLHISDYATGVSFNNKYLSSLQSTLKCFSNEIISADREQNKNKSLRGDLSIFEAAQRSPQLVCHNREREKNQMNKFPIDYSAGNDGGLCYRTFIVQPVIRNMEDFKLSNFGEMGKCVVTTRTAGNHYIVTTNWTHISQLYN